MPVGSFSIRVPPSGHGAFYAVTFKGTSTKPPVVALSLTGATPKGNVAIAAVEGKTKRGAPVKIFVAITNAKLRFTQAAAASTMSFTGFAPSGTFTPAGSPTVTPLTCARFDDDYHALNGLGYSWAQWWLNQSPPTDERDIKHILANMIAADRADCH
jgi:hypothetical protein